MKKYLFIILLFPLIVKGQDTLEIMDLPLSTSVGTTDWFMKETNTHATQRIQATNFLPFTLSSTLIYPRDITKQLALGTSSLRSGYILNVTGRVYISDQLTFGASTPGIVFNGTSIINENASHDLLFYSPAYGSSVTLSEIMSQSSANNVASNGLTKTTVGTTNTWKLGGTLSEYTGIDAGAYTFQVSNPSGGLFSLSGTSTTIRGTNILINPTGYVRLYTTTNDVRLRDTSFTASVEDGVFRMGNTSSEWTTAVDNDLVLRSGGGTGRVKIEDISYTQYTPQDTGIQVLGVKYLDDQDTIFRYWDGTAFVEFGSGGGTGDVSKSGTPVNGQMTGWTNDETIEGISELTYDADTFHISKNVETEDSVFLNYIGEGTVGFLIKTETGAIDTGTLVASKISESTDYVLFDGDTLATRIYSRSVGGGTGSATPAGMTGSVQLNDGGVMGYDANLSYTGDTLKVGTFYAFDSDRNTGIGHPSADQLSLKAGGDEMINITTTNIYTKSSGTNNFELGPTYFGDVTTTGGVIQNVTTSSTVPTYLPRRSDVNTGIGSASSDQLSLISGGVEGIRIYPDSNSFKKPIKVNALSGTTTRPAVMTSTGQLSVGDDEEVLHVVTINISSVNLLAGDSLLILAAPGAGKVIVPVRLCIYYNMNTSTYSTLAPSAIYTYGDATKAVEQIYHVGTEIFNANTTNQVYWDRDSFSGNGYLYLTNSQVHTNEPIWLDLYVHSGAGTGTAKLKLWYTIADFN